MLIACQIYLCKASIREAVLRRVGRRVCRAVGQFDIKVDRTAVSRARADATAKANSTRALLPESLCALIAVAIVIYDRPITVTTDTAKSPALYAGGGGGQGEILIVTAQWHIPRKVESRDIAGAVVQAADLVAVLARVCGEVPRDCWIEIVDGADIHESDRMRRRPVDKDVRIRSLAA